MRVLATADLHYNHARSRRLAEELIDQINDRHDFDALLVIGDTADGDSGLLEECLGRFTFAGPKLFVAGNHELWTHSGDSYRLFREELPGRIRAAGWHWLQDEPYVGEGVAIVGSIGWYDYSFSVSELGIPRRFYEHKVAPAAAAYSEELRHLVEGQDDIPQAAREIYARWNDSRFVALHRSDEAFLGEVLEQMKGQLGALRDVPRVVVAVHHLPFAELAPEMEAAHWRFARAFLGSRRLGEAILGHANVRAVLCGHSHFPMELQIGSVRVVNIGSGYRQKRLQRIDTAAL